MKTKVTIIGSTQYKDKFMEHEAFLVRKGYEVKIPAFDDHKNFNELDVCRYNLSIIEWADEVHIIWDQRSFGTIFDFGMAFALKKKVVVVYLEKKTFAGVMTSLAFEQGNVNGHDYGM